MARPALPLTWLPAAASAFLLLASACPADVFVLTNRTPRAVTVSVAPSNRVAEMVTLASGEVRAFWDDAPLPVAFVAGGVRQSFELAPNTAHFLGVAADGSLGLRQIGLGEAANPAPLNLPGEPTGGPLTLPVQIYVDDDEATHRALWEPKLRSRVAAASKVLTKHAGVALRVEGVGRWNSDNSQNNFIASLAEFERQVNPRPARLAIGFTSQYEAVRGRVHLGGTRGPLRRHLMVREWSSRVTEAERLELLLHELGHFLGATHSPQADSVMRPVLGDSQARRVGFAIRFDPVNSLITAMVGEQMRRRGVDSFARFTPAAKERLNQVYSVMAKTMPRDGTSRRFVARTNTGRQATRSAPPVKQVLRAITTAAKANAALPEAAQLTGDRLTEHYVERAAAAAADLPETSAAEALLIALGVGLEEGRALDKLPLTKSLAGAETPAERAARAEALGKPTLFGRRDLAKHFFVSAMITAAAGAETAHQLGLAKEMLDASGGSGFSFADLAADRAGVRFGEAVLNGRPPIERLAGGFRLMVYMPGIQGLPEGLTAAQFLKQYGGTDDPRFTAMVDEIDKRIDNAPAYAPLPPGVLGIGR
ncbi:MAG: matrixin family metalloprotease [Planctomycetota bacterium]